jgi:hypothetical protein
LEFDKKKQAEGIPLTPTGYAQPPTPDFPPPSPHTALVGIEERMAVIDVSIRKLDWDLIEHKDFRLTKNHEFS